MRAAGVEEVGVVVDHQHAQRLAALALDQRAQARLQPRQVQRQREVAVGGGAHRGEVIAEAGAARRAPRSAPDCAGGAQARQLGEHLHSPPSCTTSAAASSSRPAPTKAADVREVQHFVAQARERACTDASVRACGETTHTSGASPGSRARRRGGGARERRRAGSSASMMRSSSAEPSDSSSRRAEKPSSG
jgi:hypothetical protein